MPAHKHIFAKFLNEYFIETGTYKGEGIQIALDVGFPNIHSVEIHEPYWRDNLLKFHNNPRVKIWYGSTEDQLWNMIKDIKVPCTFWLDAHWSGLDTPTHSGQNCPLQQELETIAKHPIKNHTILIDDMRCCNTEHFTNPLGFISKQMIENWIKSINPQYTIYYEHSWEPFDILVARIN